MIVRIRGFIVVGFFGQVQQIIQWAIFDYLRLSLFVEETLYISEIICAEHFHTYMLHLNLS